MKRTAALLACAQAILLAACASPPAERSAVPQASPTTAPAAQRAGYGVIESASVVSLSSSPAAGGATAPASSPTMAYRVKMEDGATQNIVQAGERFELGERVQVTSDGRLARP